MKTLMSWVLQRCLIWEVLVLICICCTSFAAGVCCGRHPRIVPRQDQGPVLCGRHDGSTADCEAVGQHRGQWHQLALFRATHGNCKLHRCGKWSVSNFSQDCEAMSKSTGTYVKVTGSLRNLPNGERYLMAMNIHCIEDLNEITSHMLEVVQAHMQLTGKVCDLVEDCTVTGCLMLWFIFIIYIFMMSNKTLSPLVFIFIKKFSCTSI